MKELEVNLTMFDNIKHIDLDGNEYWSARELQKVLDYAKWENFHKVIKQAICACNNSNNKIKEHFPEVRKMLEVGNKAKMKVIDYKLSRYACYLIAQNADPRKEVVALAQTYFAVQTRKMELSEKEYSELSEDKKRLFRRNQAKKGNFNLNKTAVKVV